MLNNSEKTKVLEEKKISIPVLAMSGKFISSAKIGKYKCSMCGQVLDSKIISPFDHSFYCTGY